MSNHTPGPWMLVETPDPAVISDWHVQIGDYAVTLFPYKRQTSPCGAASALITDRTKMADARLIAAAPDLLDALRNLLRWVDEPSEGAVEMLREQRHIEQARAAIAKATGEQR